MRILTVIGARPQFIKAATVSRIINSSDNIDEILVHTGQHFDNNMSEVFFDELEIPAPKYNLGIFGGNHGEQTGKMLQKLETVILDEKPDLVMVYGDTNSTLAGALAAVKLHIPIAHVEAGLRSFNKKMPEEINRILTDHSSDILFTPTDTAFRNLRNEGIDKDKIIPVGDVMYDATIYYGLKAEKDSKVLTELGLEEKGFILSTIHRAENTNDPIKLVNIFNSLESIANDHIIVMPIHPRTRKILGSLDFSFNNTHINFIDPVGYLDIMMLEKNSNLIITDSGGMQKEAYFHKVPCVTLREETEWVELVENGWNFLANPSNLPSAVRKALNVRSGRTLNFYGEGDASIKISNKLSEF